MDLEDSRGEELMDGDYVFYCDVCAEEATEMCLCGFMFCDRHEDPMAHDCTEFDEEEE